MLPCFTFYSVQLQSLGYKFTHWLSHCEGILYAVCVCVCMRACFCIHNRLATTILQDCKEIAKKLQVAVWLSGNALVSINEVTQRREQLVLEWMTIHGYTVFVFNQATQVNSAFHPSGVGKLSTSLPGWGEGGTSSPVLGGR